jgi:lipopolysaccharide transport system ATP-binding protein
LTRPEAVAAAGATAITVNGVSKVYQIYARPEDRLKQSLFRHRRTYYREFWALRDLSLSIERGHTVGIVGRNGSGKSTLLQIICGTLRPTSGTASIHGRVSALLELGSGFNPDFTGRENVYLNSAILGLSRDETDAVYDEIVAFADIGDHLEQPIKTYSTGMVMRLAFAAAIAVKPDILVVDEALAVGDEAFQRRCLARIEAIKEAGATILFVSHSASQVVDICDRAVLLDHGELLYDGTPRRAINAYHKLLYGSPETAAAFRGALLAARQSGAPVDEKGAPAVTAATTATAIAATEDDGLEEQYNPGLMPQSTTDYDARGARIGEVRITTLDGRPVNMLLEGRRYAIRFPVELSTEAWGVAVGTRIKTLSGVELGGASTIQTERMFEHVPAGSRLEVCHEFECRLIEGTYFINAGISAMVGSERQWIHRRVDAAMFQIIPRRQRRYSNGPVCFAFDSRATIDP